MGGEAEKSQRVHRDVVVLDGRGSGTHTSHLCLPRPFHLPQCSVLLVRWGFVQKMSTLGVGDGGMGDGGWGMEDVPFSSRRPEVGEVGSMAKRVGDLLGMGGI